MRAIVTGGCGFIGSHLTRALVSLGHKVTVVDDLSVGRPGNIPIEADLVQESVTNLSQLTVIFEKADIVYHLAAQASVPKSIDKPLKTFHTNVDGTLNVLEAAKRAGVKRVVFASSSAIYGNNESIAQREIDPPMPMSPYAVSKLVGEQYCDIYAKLYSLSTLSLRYFNVYGPGQSANSSYALAIPKFIDCAKHDRNLPIYGDGTQARDFIFVTDVVSATIHLAGKPVSGVYNVGSCRPMRIIDLAKFIIQITDSKSELEFHPAREGDPRRTCANITRLVEAGFFASWTLEKGLEEMI